MVDDSDPRPVPQRARDAVQRSAAVDGPPTPDPERQDHAPGHAPGHGHDELTVDRRTRPVLAAVAGGLAVVTVLLVVVLWPPARPDTGDQGPADQAVVLTGTQREAVVDAVTEEPCEFAARPEEVCRTVTFRLTEGPDEGTTHTETFPLAEAAVPDLDVGDRVVLDVYTGPEGRQYFYADQQRRPTLIWLTVMFAVVVVALARLRGLAALAALALSLVILVRFTVPAILDGSDPVLVALVSAAAIALLALYLTHGITWLATVALLGSLASLALTGLLAWLSFEVGRFTGFVGEEVFILQDLGLGIPTRGLLLAGVIIGVLGALDDVTVTQASAVAELRAADPTMGRLELYRAAMRVGRDHVASAVNTLALAYAGASMPLILLFTLSGLSLGSVANSEVVATEIVRTLVGSIGLVAAVPFTTGLAALVAEEPTPGPPDGEPAMRPPQRP